ncbi:DUF6527 family protein [Micromonospora sp. 4G55]|uniref:DUF6527 family protein n=1 Tax=Micromonospora sp. 4G55 TaxID=2806102 RepID=UPI001A5DE138|nr:DUF6527 family protein [Micromonospora sp. 4G55]MBM0255553.1 hypothetical protein [Micromonospora sp. 4G55]
MTKVSRLAPEFIDTFPTQLDPGVLYVSAKYSTAAHLCCCGCREEVITPLSPAQWVLTFDGTVSLQPSVGNWSLPCRSHYIIDGGRVRWSRPFTNKEIKLNRQGDRQELNAARAHTPSWLRRIVHRIKPWKR